MPTAIAKREVVLDYEYNDTQEVAFFFTDGDDTTSNEAYYMPSTLWTQFGEPQQLTLIITPGAPS